MTNQKISFHKFDFDKLSYVANDLLNILFTQAKELPIEEILSKICVSQPYFAFKKIYRYENILIAQIKTEQPNNDEITSMSIGEAGRHMAVLGTCVCALDQEDKYYYLVKDAEIVLTTRNITAICGNDNLYIAIESLWNLLLQNITQL